MAKPTTTTPVKGGWVKRDTQTGQVRSVCSGSGVVKGTPKSAASVAEASARRSAALKRLADR